MEEMDGYQINEQEEKQITYGITGKQQYDSYASAINDIPLAVQFYYMDMSLIGKQGRNYKPFTHSGYVINLLYMPFLEKDDVNIIQIPYDQKNLGSVSDTSTAPEEDVFVYKLWQAKVQDKKIGSIPRYPMSITQKPTGKDWRNESKFYQEPYHFITINDYINAPLRIDPKFVNNIFDVMVSQPISMTGGYTIYVDGYKGDKNKGANEGMFCSAGLDLPTSGSQYAQFMATSKNSFLQDNVNASREEKLQSAKKMGKTILKGVAVGTAATAAAIATAPVGGTGMAILGGGLFNGANKAALGAMIPGALSGLTTEKVQKINRIESSQATVSDILSSPRNVNMSSSDILMTMDRTNKRVWWNRYMITQDQRNKILDYWTLYGYQQNKLMKLNLKSRKYFNYVKTINANIKGDNLDKSELEAIKQIYDSGIRFWHYFDLNQDGLRMHDYHMDNREREVI